MGSEILLNPVMVNKLQNYFNDSAYRDAIQSAASYNANLASERKMRLPFLDSQTGVAQNHSNLWMDARQRLPGFKEGQIYTYPSKRWRKHRRQYLANFMQPRYPVRKDVLEDVDAHAITTVENVAFSSNPIPSVLNDDSKDSSISFKEEAKLASMKDKDAWYDDYLDIPDAGEFDEPDPDSDYDYEETYGKKKKKRGNPKSPRTPSTTRAPKRKITYDPITDAEKPFACDLCGARYKTRPGLTYHYTHSHKDKEDEDDDDMIPSSPKRDDGTGRRHSRGPATSLPPPVLHPQQQLNPMQLQPPTLQPQAPPPHHHMHMAGGGPMVPPSPSGSIMPPPQMMQHHHNHPPPPHLIPQQPPQHPHHMGMHPQMPNMGGNGPPPPAPGNSANRPPIPSALEEPSESSSVKKGTGPPDNLKPRVQPSPYCDFCLGDAAENKKSGGPEELVSCSDCGRSGHPTCLQFTPNMIISVKKYRWQCIECKCCSICGLSDNDDQLLFCDDCDRGYHMYCLTPPLEAPPEGSWSCTLCLAEFHKKE